MDNFNEKVTKYYAYSDLGPDNRIKTGNNKSISDWGENGY
jgi:hypothetical protein